jgi:CubicO group peptidase (beta-lactamase class C family)
MPAVAIHGQAEAGFEGVLDAFTANFADGAELGAACAITVDGETVVDLWGGDAGLDGHAWERDTMVNVFSTTKTMAAICILVLADRGELDLDAPIAHHWPEFAANGKAAITTGHVMGHTAGLPGFDPAIPVTTLYDREACCTNLAAQSPWWAPGAASGYHALTQGYLQGELVRRITGQSLGAFFRDVVARPLGADFHIGLPPEVDRGRNADLATPDRPFGADSAEPGSISARVTSSCPLDAREAMTEAWREAEIPSAAGTANARGIARIHAALACGGEVDGVRLLSPSGVDAALVERHRGTDLVLHAPMRLGTGFGLPSPETPVSPNERALYWGGWGGSLCVIDLDLRMSFAYVMNKMTSTTAGDLRAAGPLLATYVALEHQGGRGPQGEASRAGRLGSPPG